jgi:uncharacterized protein YbcI
MADATHADAPAGQSVQLALSNEMVRLYKDLFGRGPTKARTNFAGPDLIICSLENTLTPAEKSMVEMGEHQRLRELRLYFQHAREKDFCGAVEQITGRTVRGFVSGMDTHQDISAEVFYLAPQTDGSDGAGPSHGA